VHHLDGQSRPDFFKGLKAMSSITDELQKDIENLDLATYYKERICMWQVSKDLRGELRVADQERQQCSKPDCLTLKGHVKLKAQARSHVPCDSVVARPLDGDIEGEIVFVYIEDGHRRGYHIGKIKWGSPTSTLIGQLSGVTNAGTHRKPLPDCEPCDRRGHWRAASMRSWSMAITRAAASWPPTRSLSTPAHRCRAQPSQALSKVS
jgi:hypothetical protein